MSKIILYIDIGDRFSEARTFVRENPDKSLEDFIHTYSPRFPTDRIPADDETKLKLSQFLFQPVTLEAGECVETGDGCKGELRLELNRLWEDEQAGGRECRPAGWDPGRFKEKLIDEEAVKIAYCLELEAIADYLRNGLSVLVVCDKMLTELIYRHVVHRAGKKCVLDTQSSGDDRSGMGSRLDQAIQGGQSEPLAGLSKIFHNLKENDVLVLRSLDMLDRPAEIELLYQHANGRRPQILAFLDPSLEARKVLRDRFSVHVPIMGLPRYVPEDMGRSSGSSKAVYCVTRLLTRKERGCFGDYDEEGLYKNVAGLNAVQFRNAMRYVGARTEPGTGAGDIYRVIRQFKTSSSGEIDIPDTTFDDIGGYEHVKHQLRRIITLIAGPVAGLDDRQRSRLIPRGLIFHGPPGTGKTLFAKAIANEMNATIQMISGPEIMDKYVGESENKLRRIFATARRNAPAVVFFDEFDSIAGQRSNYSDGGARANNAVVAQLLTELDGFRQDQTVLVIGTTNRIDIVDEALVRPSRFRPVEIGRPDTTARRRVAEIHARNFGIDVLVKDLCRLASEFLPDWENSGKTDADRHIPAAFLDALFNDHPPYRERYETETQRAGFIRELNEFFAFIHGCKGDDAEADPVLDRITEKVVEMGKHYGLDLNAENPPNPDSPEEQAGLMPMRTDIKDLFSVLVHEKEKAKGVTPEHFLDTVMELVAEYTEQFNNDEIQAVFQEAGLERHMEGRLITPNYIGRKIGLIRKKKR